MKPIKIKTTKEINSTQQVSKIFKGESGNYDSLEILYGWKKPPLLAKAKDWGV